MYRIYIMGSKGDLVIFARPMDTLLDVSPNKKQTSEKAKKKQMLNKKVSNKYVGCCSLFAEGDR